MLKLVFVAVCTDFVRAIRLIPDFFLLDFQLPVHDVYNLFFMKSNLFKFVISKTLKNNPGSRGNKRKFQAPQVRLLKDDL